jgi:calcineurin-like phosphoesterase family protein
LSLAPAGSCVNVHGHIHARRINDPRYINICVEQINYTPVSYDWLVRCEEGDGVRIHYAQTSIWSSGP